MIRDIVGADHRQYRHRRARRSAAIAAAAALLGTAPPAAADALLLAAGPPDRSQPLTIIYRVDGPVAGTGRLRLLWRDADGRTVEDRTIPVRLGPRSTLPITLDLRRAVTMQNRLRATLVLDRTGAAQPGGRQRQAAISFVVPPALEPWADFPIILWQPRSSAELARLERLGINAGMIIARRDRPSDIAGADVGRLLAAGLPWYVENIATDFYSPYHRWFAGRPPNWAFEAVRQAFRRNPQDPAAFIRSPSLSDPVWLQRIGRRLAATVRAYRDDRPLYYSLGDETGIADLAAYWDFDLSKPSLRAMRNWLRRHYGSLAALNTEWGSAFVGWDQVTPTLTAAAMRRADENYAPWADFKAWMDEAFAEALRHGTNAVHGADGRALAGIEGGQVPGWGGYDYLRLARAVDVMELYDSGGNVDLVHAIAPRLKILTTSFQGGPAETHRMWRMLLRGARGLILWDDHGEFAGDAGPLSPRARQAAGFFAAMRRGLGALIVNSRPVTDPVAIVYSPESLRTQWMLDWRNQGAAWSTLSSSKSGADMERRLDGSLVAYLRLLAQSGVSPGVLSAAMIEDGTLQKRHYRALILPETVALSPREAVAIRRFATDGGSVIADSQPGLFDLHSRRYREPALRQLFPRPPSTFPSSVAVGRGRAVYLAPRPVSTGTAATGSEPLQAMRRLLREATVKPGFAIATADGTPATGIESHRFSLGAITILALQRAAPGSPTDPGMPVTVTLDRPAYVYDVGAPSRLGRTGRVALGLDRVRPTILALAPAELAPPILIMQRRLGRGALGAIRVTIADASPAEPRVLHLEVTAPDGQTVPYLSANLVMSGRSITRPLPLALTDPPGRWIVTAADVISGAQATATFEVADETASLDAAGPISPALQKH